VDDEQTVSLYTSGERQQVSGLEWRYEEAQPISDRRSQTFAENSFATW